MNNDNLNPEQRVCRNCGTALLGAHCWHCGQPVKGLIRPLPSWIADFLDTMFEYDGRLWRTLGPLLVRPGFLSREYIAGRRVRYVSPVRLFLFMTILLFVVVRLVADVEGVNVGSSAPDPADVPRIERVIDWLPQAEREEVLAEALSPPIVENARSGGAVQIDGIDAEQFEFQVRWLPDAMNERLTAAAQQMGRNLARLQQEPQAFVDQMLSVAPQTLIMILPLFALLLKLFYLFTGRLYLQHLLVAMHSHSFIAGALMLIIGLDALVVLAAPIPWLASGLGWLIIALWIWIPVNLYLTQKFVYAQGWVLTTLKYVVIGLLYMLLMVFGSLVALLLSLLLW